MKIYLALIPLIALALPLGCEKTAFDRLKDRAILKESNKIRIETIDKKIKEIQQTIHDLQQGFSVNMQEKDKVVLNNKIDEQRTELKQKQAEKEAAERNIIEEEQKMKDEKEAAKKARFEQRNIDRRRKRE